MINAEQLKIKQSVLKMVRKISGASFSKKLGEDFNICFTLMKKISVISMYATKSGDHIECFKNWYGCDAGWQASFPKNVDDIHRFEAEVEKGLAEIFEYIKG